MRNKKLLTNQTSRKEVKGTYDINQAKSKDQSSGFFFRPFRDCRRFLKSSNIKITVTVKPNDSIWIKSQFNINS